MFRSTGAAWFSSGAGMLALLPVIGLSLAISTDVNRVRFWFLCVITSVHICTCFHFLMLLLCFYSPTGAEVLPPLLWTPGFFRGHKAHSLWPKSVKTIHGEEKQQGSVHMNKALCVYIKAPSLIYFFSFLIPWGAITLRTVFVRGKLTTAFSHIVKHLQYRRLGPKIYLYMSKHKSSLSVTIVLRCMGLSLYGEKGQGTLGLWVSLQIRKHQGSCFHPHHSR